MISAIFTLLIYLVVFGVLWWAVNYTIDTTPVPDPPARFIKIALVLVCASAFIILLLNMTGVETGMNLPRLG